MKWKLSQKDIRDFHLVNVHRENDDCHKFGCVVHHWSKHHMREMPLHWRVDANKFERICPHGIGHPDPDSANWIKRILGDGDDAFWRLVHGCCGICCNADRFHRYSELIRAGD